MSDFSQVEGLTLPGLDGTNPLGFLAAMGALRLLTNGHQSVKLSWKLSDGIWQAHLHGVGNSISDLSLKIHTTVVDKIISVTSPESLPTSRSEVKILNDDLGLSAWAINKKLPFKACELRQIAKRWVETGKQNCRDFPDWLAAFGVEAFEDKEGNYEKTELCMVRAGDSNGQGLLAYGKRIIETVTSDQIQAALGKSWNYLDDQCALRWDPSEDRPYSRQWRNPSKVGALSEKGANFLGLFGMPCFPVIPLRNQVETTGFGLHEPKQSSMTWPIWKHPIQFNIARSLLTLAELQRKKPNSQVLNSLGIDSAYRCNRIMTSTYYANFTPTQKVG